MFYARELSGLISPYSPGVIGRSRIVGATQSVHPSAPAGRSTREPSTTGARRGGEGGNLEGDASGTNVARPAISAYERAMHPDTPRRRVMLASEMMTKQVVTLSSTAILREAYQLFTSKRFRHVPCVDAAMKLVGILSDRDLLRRAAHIGAIPKPTQAAWEDESVSSVMSHQVLVASPDTEMREVARVLFHERIGCMPIVDDAQLLVGIITRSDVLRTLLVEAPLELWR